MADFGTPPKFEGRPDESLATFQMQVNIQIAARGINVNRRVGFVISCLAGSAQLWAAVRYADGLPDNVDTLFDHLRAEFASESTVMARRIAFENVRQRGTIEDYIDKFRAAALLVGGVGDDEMKTRFIQELIPRIRRVNVPKSRTLPFHAHLVPTQCQPTIDPPVPKRRHWTILSGKSTL
eukprot:m.236720 g.236720  ORF g.236720 m.236720 type:complete len:180 (+) comp26551_c0_seq7:161-700(+)